jgi:FkbM family methyltransferase
MKNVNHWFADNGDITLRLNYPINENSIVFDLGGYVGDWTQRISQKYNPNIFVFEPIPDLINSLKNKFSNNNKIKVFPFGLSNETKQIPIYFSNDGSSFYTNQNNKEILCDVVSIVDFIKENKINNIDLMKINIEGDEFPLLESMLENNLITYVTDIQVQFHQFIPNAVARRELIHKKLSETHKLTYNYEFVWENWQKK